jgi:large subunit ribosomal protein L13
MKTYSPSIKDITRQWHFFDAENQVLGRLATQVAKILMGKHKTEFVRHLDIGDHVVIVNAEKIAVTGNKAGQKIYHHHSGFPGGMKVTTFAQMLAAHPERILINAVSGMLPDNKLKDPMLKHLHVYPGPVNPYAKQFKA